MMRLLVISCLVLAVVASPAPTHKTEKKAVKDVKKVVSHKEAPKKVQLKAAPKVATKATPKVATKAAPKKVQLKAAPKVATKATPKVATKAAPKVATKAAPKVATKAAPKKVSHLHTAADPAKKHGDWMKVVRATMVAAKAKPQEKTAPKKELDDETKRIYAESKKKHRDLTPYGVNVAKVAKPVKFVAHKEEAKVAGPEGTGDINVPKGQEEAVKPGFLGKGGDNHKDDSPKENFGDHDQDEAFKKGFYKNDYAHDGRGNAAVMGMFGVVVALLI